MCVRKRERESQRDDKANFDEEGCVKRVQEAAVAAPALLKSSP